MLNIINYYNLKLKIKFIERKVNEYRNIVDNEKNSEEENLSTVRNFFQDNDDFVVSDSGSEEVYFLTTKCNLLCIIMIYIFICILNYKCFCI